MNLNSDPQTSFFEQNIGINQTAISFAEYVYDKLKHYNEEYQFWEEWELEVRRNGSDEDSDHRTIFITYVQDKCVEFTDMLARHPDPRELSYEDISLHFMCNYFYYDPPICFNSPSPRAAYRWPNSIDWHNAYPLSYQFNRSASEKTMHEIYNAIEFGGYNIHDLLEIDNAEPDDDETKEENLCKKQRLYYHITNDFMELFDKIQDDCDCMPQLSIHNYLPLGCLTPHPDCKTYSHFFSPGIPMEYIRYLMTQTIQDDSFGWLWLKTRIDNEFSNPTHSNTDSLSLKNLSFEMNPNNLDDTPKEYEKVLAKYQAQNGIANNMERTFTTLMHQKQRDSSYYYIHHTLLQPEDFVREKERALDYYRQNEVRREQQGRQHRQQQTNNNDDERKGDDDVDATINTLNDIPASPSSTTTRTTVSTPEGQKQQQEQLKTPEGQMTTTTDKTNRTVSQRSRSNTLDTTNDGDTLKKDGDMEGSTKLEVSSGEDVEMPPVLERSNSSNLLSNIQNEGDSSQGSSEGNFYDNSMSTVGFNSLPTGEESQDNNDNVKMDKIEEEGEDMDLEDEDDDSSADSIMSVDDYNELGGGGRKSRKKRRKKRNKTRKNKYYFKNYF